MTAKGSAVQKITVKRSYLDYMSRDCGPDPFYRKRVGSDFVQSNPVLDNALISEPGQMYKNGSDSDQPGDDHPSLNRKAGYCPGLFCWKRVT